MSLFNRITQWAANQFLTSSALNGEFDNLVNGLNNLDGATTAWTNVKGALNGNALRVQNIANGTSAADAAAYGQVTVIQYTGPTQTGTETDSSSNSYVDVSGLSVSITPKLSTSHVLIKAIVTIRFISAGAQFPVADLTITDSSNNIVGNAWIAAGGADNTTSITQNIYMNVVIEAWDAPGSTASKTYKVRGRRNAAGSGGTINFNISAGSTISQIAAWEYNQ